MAICIFAAAGISGCARREKWLALIREPLPLPAASIVPLTRARALAIVIGLTMQGYELASKGRTNALWIRCTPEGQEGRVERRQERVAQKHLRSIKNGDRIFYYHSGDERAIVGTVKAVSDAYPDPEDPSGKYVAVDVAPVTRLPRPVTLAEIMADAAFKDFPLVRIARLSVMPVTDEQWARIERMAGKAPRGGP